MNDPVLEQFRRRRARVLGVAVAVAALLLVLLAPTFVTGTSGGMSCCVGDRGGHSEAGSSEAGGGDGSGGHAGGVGGGMHNADADRQSSGDAPTAHNGPGFPDQTEHKGEFYRAVEFISKNPDLGNGNEVTGAEGFELGIAAKAWLDDKIEKRNKEKAEAEAKERANAARAAEKLKETLAEMDRRAKEDEVKQQQVQKITQP